MKLDPNVFFLFQGHICIFSVSIWVPSKFCSMCLNSCPLPWVWCGTFAWRKNSNQRLLSSPSEENGRTWEDIAKHYFNSFTFCVRVLLRTYSQTLKVALNLFVSYQYVLKLICTPTYLIAFKNVHLWYRGGKGMRQLLTKVVQHEVLREKLEVPPQPSWHYNLFWSPFFSVLFGYANINLRNISQVSCGNPTQFSETMHVQKWLTFLFEEGRRFKAFDSRVFFPFSFSFPSFF